MKIKPFGHNSMAAKYGYDLELIISWLEDMVATEDEDSAHSKIKRKRVDMAHNALELLNEIQDMYDKN